MCSPFAAEAAKKSERQQVERRVAEHRRTFSDGMRIFASSAFVGCRFTRDAFSNSVRPYSGFARRLHVGATRGIKVGEKRTALLQAGKPFAFFCGGD